MLTRLTTERRVAAAAQSPGSLTVLYDADCALCVRCRRWLETQRTHVPLHFVATASPEAVGRWGPHLPWLGKELVVVSDRGEAWVGPAAFLLCLWATVDYRLWSHRLSSRALAPMAEHFFTAISTRRSRIAPLLGHRWSSDGSVECADGRCRHTSGG